MTHFLIFVPMLQKYLTISVNARSLLPFIDEFVRQGIVSQISITLFLKNTSKDNIDTGVKMLHKVSVT